MDQEKLGNIIKDIRVKNKLTQSEFASKLNVSYQAVSKWENGKNIPDISILKKISEEFDVDISYLLDINKKPNKLNINYKYFILIFIIVCFVICLFFMFQRDSFIFKKLSTNCDSFKITGSIAYNKDKSSIYISDINYCGVPDKTIYDSINCVLYEEHEGKNFKISECKMKENITLDEYLENMSINVQNYSSSCKFYKDNYVYIEIKAKEEEKEVSYKIPLIFEDNC